MNECISKIKEYERNFSDNQYDGVGKTAFEIHEGDIPVMISAPHAINQYRDGEVKWADMYTGGISKYVYDNTHCHIIYSSKFTETDPNYDEPGKNKYQEELEKYIKSHDIRLLIDIHGAAKKREYAVEMGTAPIRDSVSGEIVTDDVSLLGNTFISEDIKSILENSFKELKVEKKEIWKNIIFDAGDQNTVTKYISSVTNTACIQLEINGLYRDPDNEEAFTSLVNALNEIVLHFSRIDWNKTIK